MYKLTDNPDTIIRTTDGACIPRGHRWWTEYEEWLAEGHNPEPVDAPSLDSIWDKIKAERDRRKLEGGYQAGGYWFHSDTFSRTQQIGLVIMGAAIPPGLMWKTMSGEFVAMTQTLAGQVFQAAAAHDMDIFTAAETHKAAMEASADPGSYDFSVGWPLSFGE